LEIDGLDTVWLMDSFPVALVKLGHRFKAKVAPPLANAGYCSTQKLYDYGVRVPVVGRSQPGTLPRPESIGVTSASNNDGKVFEQIRSILYNNDLYGDKVYQLPDEEEFDDKQRLAVPTPVKKHQGQEHLDAADPLFSMAVSRIRQPIESLLAWIEQPTGIESASKVRSYADLMVHVFGRLAAAVFFWSHLRVSS
jgi:hypothetical protein